MRDVIDEIIGCYEKNSQNKKKLFKVKDIIIES